MTAQGIVALTKVKPIWIIYIIISLGLKVDALLSSYQYFCTPVSHGS